MKIALVSDTHLTPRVAAFGDNWAVARDWIEAAGPDLVVNLGDITADGVERPDELDAARTAFTGLGPAVRFVPGNHDIGDNPLEPGAPTDHPLDFERLAHYRRLFGPDWWSLERDGWQIVALNAQLFATGTDAEEEQFAWMEERLGAGRGPLGVLLHKPLFRNRPDDTEAHVRYVPALPRRRLLSALASRDLRFVASGHAHQARRLQVDGIEHVWTPSTAYCFPDAMQERIGEKIVGVVTVELTEAGHRVETVTPPGLVRHNVLDHPATSAKLAEARARLGPRAALPH
jgi:3',5'-cyclic AMP phosphodiesterase CpdA